MAAIVLGQQGATPTSWVVISPSTDNQRGWSVGQFSPAEACFITSLAARMKRNGSNNARVRYAIWEDASGVPGDLLGYTAEATVSAAPSTTGIEYSATIVSSKVGAAVGFPAAAIRLEAGKNYWFGVKVFSNAAQMGCVAGSITSRKISVAGGAMPSDPFGPSATTLSTGVPILFASGVTNSLPVGTTGGPSGAITTLFPLFEGTVTDADTVSPRLDRLAGYTIEVRKQGTTALLWDYRKTITDPLEAASMAFSIQYAGINLEEGAAYEWRFIPRDQLGGIGFPSDGGTWKTFTTANIGYVDTTASIPNAREADGVITAFTGVWHHPTVGMNMTGVKVRIRVGEAIVYETPAFITKAATPLSSFSVSGTEVGFGSATNPLPPGVFTFEMQGRAFDGGLTQWSARQAFSVNSPPDQPSDLRPVNGWQTSERPVFRFRLSDPDLQDVPGVGVVAEVEITRPDNSVFYYTTSLIDPLTLDGYLPGDTINMPVNGLYRWRVRANDGLIDGPWSVQNTVLILVAPVVTVDSPTWGQSIASSTPQIAFSIGTGGIQSYQVFVRRKGVTLPFFASQPETLTPPPFDFVYQMPPNWLKNGGIYEVYVQAITPDNLTAISDPVEFRIQFTAANDVQGVVIGPSINPRDWEPASVSVQWQQGNTGDDWRGWVVYRRLATEPPENAAPVAFITVPNQTSWLDHHPPPNRGLIYGVTQLRKVGDDLRESNPVEVPVTIALTTPVIASATRGGTHRVAAVKMETGLGGGFRRSDDTVETWGTGGAPVLIRNPENYGAESLNVSFTISGDHRGTLHEHFDDVRELVKSGDVMGVRLEHIYGWYRIVPGRWWKRGSVVGTIDISLELEEVYWNDAVRVTA